MKPASQNGISLFGSARVRGLWGWKEGKRWKPTGPIASRRNLALEASPVYEPLREVARAGFSGTSSELLFLLSKLASDSTRRSRRWPKAPNALSNALRRMAGSLRFAGIEIYFNRADHQGRRIISVQSASLVPKRSSASSAP